MAVRITRGFTLIEVVVVIGVMAVIATITLISFPQFSERVGIEQEAGKLALAARRAQSNALAVREFQPGSGIFPSYGVNVSMSNPLQYVVFGDPNATNRFESFLSEAVETTAVEKRVSIYRICGNSQSIPQGSCALSSADIIYIRPTPTIVLTGVDSGIPALYNDIKVVLRNSDGSIERNVIIWSTGQISIE
ncbi:MAG: prepilin-type N-terminal cleavage/methylation domain-containing protein [Patescibacteria group bacterium]